MVISKNLTYHLLFSLQRNILQNLLQLVECKKFLVVRNFQINIFLFEKSASKPQPKKTMKKRGCLTRDASRI